MKSLSPYCISLIAILALAISPAHADYHYASHEGSNEYPYTSWEIGAHRIQDAVDATLLAGEYKPLYMRDRT